VRQDGQESPQRAAGRGTFGQLDESLQEVASRSDARLAIFEDQTPNKVAFSADLRRLARRSRLAHFYAWKGRTASMSHLGDRGLVRVVSGTNERTFPLSGQKIGEVKRSLREVINIPYFAAAFVNRTIVDLNHALAEGDHLEFVPTFGFKGSDNRRSHDQQIAEALSRDSPALRSIADQVKSSGRSSDDRIDETLRLVRRHFLRYYGPYSSQERPVLTEVSRLLLRGRELHEENVLKEEDVLAKVRAGEITVEDAYKMLSEEDTLHRAETLRVHRMALAHNPRRTYEFDLERVRKTAVNRLKQCGFRRVTKRRCGPLVDRFVDLVFKTQDWRPFFHVEGPLPFCWNAPKDWHRDYVRYEWGHLRSQNQNEDSHQIENLCLQSARCNQHIQTSMDIEEVREWLHGSAVAARIDAVLERRRNLFQSAEWKALLAELEGFR
jgi:hypothetical protein